MFLDVVAQPDVGHIVQDLGKQFLAARELKSSQVVAVEVEQIKNLIKQRASMSLPVLLQHLETRFAAGIEDDHFPIQDGFVPEVLERVDDGCIALFKGQVVPGIE